MKITAFKYVQRLGRDSCQVSLQTQIQNMKLYLMMDVCSLDSSLNLCKNDVAMELLSAQKETIFWNCNWVKIACIFFFSVWTVWYWMIHYHDHSISRPICMRLNWLTRQFSEYIFWLGNGDSSFFLFLQNLDIPKSQWTSSTGIEMVRNAGSQAPPQRLGVTSCILTSAMDDLCTQGTVRWAVLKHSYANFL